MVLKKFIHPVFKKDQPDDSFKFQQLPQPPGKYPYRLPLGTVIPSISSQKMVFHLTGDTGSTLNSHFQQLVADEMIRQHAEADALCDKPQFLYHLGDVVYTYGEAGNYYQQFFAPYRDYPVPIFAIAGNHDGDVNPASKAPYKSLDAFMKVFCDVESRRIDFSGDITRKSMIQPNVYWTLETPLANIIGLYGNVTKFGTITKTQLDWFIEELKNAALQKPGKAIIVCVHHAPYSADTNHGSSLAMIELLEKAFAKTGILPDIVFSGHVHNYQRFSRRYSDGSVVPYIVAGAGGYDGLHTLASEGDNEFFTSNSLSAEVLLEKHCDTRHGFLKITIEKIDTELILTGEYFSMLPEIESNEKIILTLTDRFKVFCHKNIPGNHAAL